MIFLLVPAFTLTLIWAPAILHYHAPRAPIGSEMVAAARLSPVDSMLEELRRFRSSRSLVGTGHLRSQ